MSDSKLTPDNQMTPTKLGDIAKNTIRQYMKDIKESGGIDHEQALYALMLQIVVTLEVQHGKADAKRVIKEFIDDLYATI